MAEKTSRKDLKQPDEFVTYSQRALQWVVEQRTVLILGVTALALVIVAVYAWRWYTESQEEKASHTFMEAKKILDAQVISPDSSEPPPNVGSYYTSEAEKYKAAIAGFEKVIKEHGGTRTANLAMYFIAESQFQIGEFDKATQGFNAYLREEGAKGELAAFAVEGLGAALEAQGKLTEAKEQYRRLTDEPFDREIDRGLYHLARLEQKTGDPKEAARMLKEILQKYPNTIFQQEIQERIETLPEISLSIPVPVAPGKDPVPAAPDKVTPPANP